MNEQNSALSAKLISHVLLDFSTKAEMELFINYVEKTGANFYENMKNWIDTFQIESSMEQRRWFCIIIII